MDSKREPLNQQRQVRVQEYNDEGSSSTSLNDVLNRIQEMQTFVGSRLDSFDTRFENLEMTVWTKFDAFQTQFSNMELAMGTRFETLDSRLGHIDKRMQHFCTHFDNDPHP